MKNIILALSVILSANTVLASSQGSGYDPYESLHTITCESIHANTPAEKVELTFTTFKWMDESFYVTSDVFVKVNGVVHNMEDSDSTRAMVKGKIYPDLSKIPGDAEKQVVGKLQGMNDIINFTFTPMRNSYTEFNEDSAFKGHFRNHTTNAYSLLSCKVDSQFFFPKEN